MKNEEERKNKEKKEIGKLENKYTIDEIYIYKLD
jgi:hypothetical protein